MPPTHLALLRGVNVGGKNRLPMKELAAIFEAAGCTGVQTYIQSGNVVFAAGDELAVALPRVIQAAIAARFGFVSPVVIRTREELAAVVMSNPHLAEGAPEEELYVMFLAEHPDLTRVTTLDPLRSPPDTFAAIGREVYLRLPNGAARTKLTNDYFDRNLATISTSRNWRTVRSLVALLERRSGGA